MSAEPRPLFVLYVPGLDRRRLSERFTPFLQDALAAFPSAKLRTLPTTELVPTLFTGTWPHEHGIWQVRLRETVAETPWTRVLARVPDAVTTTVQGIRHVLDPGYDLATVPWRRRRRFQLRRFKYTRRVGGDLAFGEDRDIPSLFDLLGDRSRYRFTMRFSDAPHLGHDLPTPGYALELLEFYAFDVLSHWNLDDPEAIGQSLLQVDDFAERIARNCRERGVRLLLLVDHGQELVTERIDLVGLLEKTHVPASEYDRFVEVGTARLWFHTERARETILTALAREERIRGFPWQDLTEFGICFDDNRFGDVHLLARHGATFFPHDFYQPLANLFLGLKHGPQRPRLRDPRHRGNHGQHPDHPAEEGYCVLFDRDFEATTEEAPLVDFAPTVLELLGQLRPPSMRGQPLFGFRP